MAIEIVEDRPDEGAGVNETVTKNLGDDVTATYYGYGVMELAVEDGSEIALSSTELDELFILLRDRRRAGTPMDKRRQALRIAAEEIQKSSLCRPDRLAYANRWLRERGSELPAPSEMVDVYEEMGL